MRSLKFHGVTSVSESDLRAVLATKQGSWIPFSKKPGFNPTIYGTPQEEPAPTATRTETPVEQPAGEPAREHSDPTRFMSRAFAPAEPPADKLNPG